MTRYIFTRQYEYTKPEWTHYSQKRYCQNPSQSTIFLSCQPRTRPRLLICLQCFFFFFFRICQWGRTHGWVIKLWGRSFCETDTERRFGKQCFGWRYRSCIRSVGCVWRLVRSLRSYLTNSCTVASKFLLIYRQTDKERERLRLAESELISIVSRGIHYISVHLTAQLYLNYTFNLQY